MRRFFVMAVLVVLLASLFATQSSLAVGQTNDPMTQLVVAQEQAVQKMTGSSSGADVFTLYVNQFGFNDSSGDTNMTVTQGATVIIIFIWNDTLVTYNSHQLEVEGYNVTSAVISAYATTSQVQFVASLAGSFRVHCIIPCLGMANMQNGWVNVQPSPSSTTSTTATSTSSASSTTSISSTTTTSTSVTNTTLNVISSSAQDGTLLVTVTLVASNGNPVAVVPVQFYLQTDFGKLSIGSNQTLSNGSASLAYKLPSVWEGPVYISFSGTKTYAASYATANISPSITTSTGPPYVSGQVNFPDLRLVGVPTLSAEVMVGIFLTLLGCLYLVIVFVLVRIGGIGRRVKVDG